MVITGGQALKAYLQVKPHLEITLEDFKDAVIKTEKQLEDFQSQIEERLADVASLIFSAQILMLKDQAFVDAITKEIQNGASVITSVVFVVESYVKKFESLQSDYLRQKAQDIRDIGRRLLDNLLEQDERFMDVRGKIVIADDLFPSDVLKLSSEEVKGIILLSGGATSHVCILSQSLSIPLVIARDSALLQILSHSHILLDAEQGNIYINPSDQVLDSTKDKRMAQLQSLPSHEETYTKDREKIFLLANINLLGDLKNARFFKAAGIGLYRTEFPFIIRSDFPSEEEQYVIYKKLVAGMPDKEITFRTLDIGGDKVLSYFQHHSKENNPFLGMRSIRFSLEHKDIFSQQIRAILRAAIGANVRIMFPMISSLDEYISAREVFRDCVISLKQEGQEFNPNIKLGMMVELPSVVEIIDEFAQIVDFFSIGTNDFVQYMLAVDRTNEKVSNLYLPHHPSVLRALKKVVEAAQRYGKDISICGDMAHEEKYLEYFLGIGLRKFSLNPSYLPRMQKAISTKSIAESNLITQKLLQTNRVSEISNLMELS
jgi:phosphotransferase system enzyme I (PtsP)